MSRINPLNPVPADDEVQAIWREIEGAFGRVPNLFKVYSHHPPLLKANWEKVKAVMMQGSLSRKTKEAIAVLVSQDNGCQYCVAAHTLALKSVGVTDAELQAIQSDLTKADFTGKERALIAFARKANQAPLSISDAEFAAVRQTGATDSEIVEALGVMEVFTAFNKFLGSLQVEIGF